MSKLKSTTDEKLKNMDRKLDIMIQKQEQKIKEKQINKIKEIGFEKILKFRNSSTRYLKIPDGYFNELKHGHTGKVAEIIETDNNETKIIYIFNWEDYNEY